MQREHPLRYTGAVAEYTLYVYSFTLMPLKLKDAQWMALTWAIRQGACWIFESDWRARYITMRTVEALVRRECLELGEKDGRRRWRVTGKGRAEIPVESVLGVSAKRREKAR